MKFKKSLAVRRKGVCPLAIYYTLTRPNLEMYARLKTLAKAQ